MTKILLTGSGVVLDDLFRLSYFVCKILAQ